MQVCCRAATVYKLTHRCRACLSKPQSTFARFGEALGGGAFPGLDPSVLRTIRKDLVTTAAAVSGGSWHVE